MTAHTAFVLCWLIGLATAAVLAYFDHTTLAFCVLVMCTCLRSTES